MNPPGTLYLIPCPLGDSETALHLPQNALRTLSRLSVFIAENPKSARAFLKAAGHPRRLQDIEIHTLNEHTRRGEIEALIAPLLEGRDCGVVSEAGCPAVADPGAVLVRLAHRHGIRVVPLVGPSAILLALMASGLDGQRFAFHGYLPVEASRCREALLALERGSRREHRTDIFIEAPYRNQRLLHTLLETCADKTLLCVATDLTLATESIQTKTVAEWKRDREPAIDRRPTVFLMLAESDPGATRAKTADQKR